MCVQLTENGRLLNRFPAMVQKIFAKKPLKYKPIKSDQIPSSMNVLKHFIIA